MKQNNTIIMAIPTLSKSNFVVVVVVVCFSSSLLSMYYFNEISFDDKLYPFSFRYI